MAEQLELHIVIQKPEEGQGQLRTVREGGSKRGRVKEKRQSGNAPVEGFHEGGGGVLSIQAL